MWVISLPQGREPPYPFDRRICESGNCGQNKDFLTLLGIETRIRRPSRNNRPSLNQLIWNVSVQAASLITETNHSVAHSALYTKELVKETPDSDARYISESDALSLLTNVSITNKVVIRRSRGGGPLFTTAAIPPYQKTVFLAASIVEYARVHFTNVLYSILNIVSKNRIFYLYSEHV
jgi:hypothetical protein